MVNKTGIKNGVTTLSVDDILNQARATLEDENREVVTRSRVGKMFIRTVKSRGRCYQQVCRHYYDENGNRRLEIGKVMWPRDNKQLGGQDNG